MASIMYFIAQNKMKEATRNKEREDKAKLSKVNMAGSPTVINSILNEQHQREKDAKAKERSQPKANAMSVNMTGPSFVGSILHEQHQREKEAKAKQRAQSKENAKFDMAKSLFGGAGNEEGEANIGVDSSDAEMTDGA